MDCSGIVIAVMDAFSSNVEGRGASGVGTADPLNYGLNNWHLFDAVMSAVLDLHVDRSISHL